MSWQSVTSPARAVLVGPPFSYNPAPCQPNNFAVTCGSVLQVTGPESEPLNVGQSLWPAWIVATLLDVSSTPPMCPQCRRAVCDGCRHGHACLANRSESKAA